MTFRYWSLFLLLGTFFITTPALAATATTTTTLPTCAVALTPRYIYQGAPTILSWQSTSARGGYIDRIGPMTAASGSMTIAPSISTTFRATVWNNVGTTTCSAYVVVYINGSGGSIVLNAAGVPKSTDTSCPTGQHWTTDLNGYNYCADNTPQGTCTGQWTTDANGYTYCQDNSCPSGSFSSNDETGAACIYPNGTTVAPSAGATQTTGTSGTAPSTQAGPIQPTATGLIPCGGGSDALTTATECTFCDLGSLAQNLINFFLALIVPIAIGLFAYAGILYFTSGSNPGNIEKAKQIFKTSFVGFLIAISAWLLIGTAINILVAGNDGWQSFAWNKLQCNRNDRARAVNVSTWLGGLFGSAGTPPAQVSQNGVQPGYVCKPGEFCATIQSIGADGKVKTLSFPQTQLDTSLQGSYAYVSQHYSSYIAQACQGSPIPNCTQVVTADIAQESGGKPGAVSPAGATGLMQVIGSKCGVADVSCQIQEGTSYLNLMYTKFGNSVPNALAAYNGGPSTAAGKSPSGLNGPMVASINCPGEYAYQCATNPGGLQQTQQYIGNICRSLVLQNNNSCNTATQ